MQSKLARTFYARLTSTVARELIGMHLVRVYRGKRLVGRIVETEAYQGPQDLAAHSARGRTVVTREQGIPHAVLIRAVEPLSNVRGKTWGPGLLCKATHIDRKRSGADLSGES